MTEKNSISDYITFPTTFENYKWYKPILVFIVSLIIFLILSVVVTVVFYVAFGTNFMTSIMNGGYEVLNTELGQIFTDLGVIIMIPSLYIGSKVIKDRPFSAYASSRGGWNFKLYLKAFVIPFALILIAQGVDVLIHGTKGVSHFSILFFILTLIMVPIQCIAEEFVFRGLVMQTFGSWFKIPVLAIILQGIFFAVIHDYNSLGVIEVLVAGLIYGILTWKTNGIEVSSAFHTANNLSIALFVMFGLSSTSSTVGQYDFIFAVIFDLILFAVVYFVGMKTDWFGEIKENPEN